MKLPMWVAGALGGLAQTLVGVAATLLTDGLAGGVSAGLPQTLQVLGTAGAAPLIARRSTRSGRGVGLAFGALVGAAGCGVLVAAAALGSVPLVLAGSLASGAGAAAVALGRYAAVDAARPGTEARAVSGVLAAVAIGAVVGPNLLAPAADLDRTLGLPPFTAGFVVAGLAFLAAGAGWAVNSRRASATVPSAARPSGSGPALALLAVANLVMVATMTMAPVQLHHAGGSLQLVGAVVSVHIVAMFAPAPLSGWLVDRFGISGGAAIACVTLLSATSLAAFSAQSTVGLTAAVALLGVGWSAAVVTGSVALVRQVAPNDRPRLEAAGEVGMGVAAAVGGATSGFLVAAGGYALLATAGAACVAAALIPLSLRLAAAEV